MPSIQHKSRPARTALTAFALFLTFLSATALLPAAGEAAPPEPGEPPQLAFEPGSYDFGLQRVESGASQANFQLRNVGGEAVQVDSLQISGPGSGAFWTNSNCAGFYLQPNESCNVQVYFGPYDSGDYAAQVRADVGSYSFVAGLTGTGGRAVLAPVTDPTDFGAAAVGSVGTTHEIAVSNIGNMPGGAFIAVISGGAVGSFQLLDENCTGDLLAPAATCMLQVRFRPLSEGVKTAALGLFGDQGGGTQIVLTGVGTAPESAASTASPEKGIASVSIASEPPNSAKLKPYGAEPKPHRRRQRLHRRNRRVALDAGRVLTRSG